MPRWEKILWVAGPLLAMLVILATFLRGADRTDLSIFLKAADNLRAGRPVYDLADANEHTKPPLATELFVPLLDVDRATLGRVWDGMNVLLLVALAYFFVRRLIRRQPPTRRTWVILTLLWLLNPWNKEIRLGQYNLLTFAFLLLAAIGRPAFLSGGLAALAVLLKPTNIFFVPWAWKHSPARRTFLWSAAVLTLILALLYVHHAGLHALIDDHRIWLRVLPQSAAKHLHRSDNYGLVRILDEAGGAKWMPTVQLASGALVLLSAFAADWITGLVIAGIFAILLTPMAWFQNYVLLLPLVVQLFARGFSPQANFGEKWFARLALVSLYLGLQIFPALAGQGILKSYSDLPVPLWSLLIATALWALSLIAAPFPRRSQLRTANA